MLCSSLKSAFKVNHKTRVFQKGEKESFLDFEWSRLSYNVLVYWLHVCLPGGNLVCAVSSVSRGTMQRTCGKRGQVQGQLWDSPCDLIKEITLGLSQKKKKKVISLLLLLNPHMLPTMFSEIRYTCNYFQKPLLLLRIICR